MSRDKKENDQKPGHKLPDDMNRRPPEGDPKPTVQPMQDPQPHQDEIPPPDEQIVS